MSFDEAFDAAIEQLTVAFDLCPIHERRAFLSELRQLIDALSSPAAAPIPFSLLRDDPIRLADAEIVVGVESTTGRKFLLFGASTIEATQAPNGEEGIENIRFVRILYRPDELDDVLKLIAATFGRHDYHGVPGSFHAIHLLHAARFLKPSP